MAVSTYPQLSLGELQLAFRQALFLFAAVFFVAAAALAADPQQPVSIQTNETQIIIDGVYESEVFSVGKDVVIRGQARGVLSFGGDVIVEGKVVGDVATVGGSVIQKPGASIGGDVIILGGKYSHDDEKPVRGAEGETVIFAGYEDEFRRAAQNPADIFAPELTFSFISLRMLAVLFWFVVSLAGATIAPGAVGRAAARFQLTSLKVIGVGFLGFLGLVMMVIASAGFLPNYIGILVGLMTIVLLFLSYVYGRITLHAVVGKFFARRIFGGEKQSETLALLIGSLVCTLLTSLPYIWAFSIFIMLIVSVGLILTGVSRNSWKRSEKL